MFIHIRYRIRYVHKITFPVGIIIPRLGNSGGLGAGIIQDIVVQVSYVGYTPPARNAYSGRGWRGGRGRGRGRGRGARAPERARRPRRDEPAKPATLTLNG